MSYDEKLTAAEQEAERWRNTAMDALRERDDAKRLWEQADSQIVHITIEQKTMADENKRLREGLLAIQFDAEVRSDPYSGRYAEMAKAALFGIESEDGTPILQATIQEAAESVVVAQEKLRAALEAAGEEDP